MSHHVIRASKLPGLMLLMTARKALPSLQLGPKSFTWTPSCLLTCVNNQCPFPFQTHFSPNLGLDPLEQSLFGSNLPALLSFPADASLPHRTVVIRAETIIMTITIMLILKTWVTLLKTKVMTILKTIKPASIARCSWTSLPEFLKHSRVLLDLPEKLCFQNDLQINCLRAKIRLLYAILCNVPSIRRTIG